MHYDLADGGVDVDEDDGEVNTTTQRFKDYPNRNITLGDHHTIKPSKGSKRLPRGPVTMNLRKTMIFLTEKADFRKILQTDRFVKKHKQLIFELAEADSPVRLFDRDKDGTSATACLAVF